MLKPVLQTLVNLSNALALGLLCMLAGCDTDKDASSLTESASSISSTTLVFEQLQLSDIAVSTLLDNFFQQIRLDLARAVSSGSTLDDAIQSFLESPDPGSLEIAQQHWLAAHSDYEATALYRYFFQQVMAMNTGDLDLSLTLDRLQYQINYWPILPGYIDYLGDYPDSGLVSDITLPLSRETLIQQHGAFDLSEVLLGFHPLEFLLWGENPPAQEGRRPVRDFQPILAVTLEQQSAGLQLGQLINNRRRQLLSLLGSILVEDLTAVQQLWTRNEAALRTTIEMTGNTGVVALILDATENLLWEEILVRSLYPMLNGEFDASYQSPYSHSSENAVMAQLEGIEKLLTTRSGGDLTFELMLTTLWPEFLDTFYMNFDASKICLTLLYSSAALSSDPQETIQREFEIVECINLITNMTNSLERVEQVFR